jgi:hypothetical protein
MGFIRKAADALLEWCILAGVAVAWAAMATTIETARWLKGGALQDVEVRYVVRNLQEDDLMRAAIEERLRGVHTVSLRLNEETGRYDCYVQGIDRRRRLAALKRRSDMDVVVLKRIGLFRSISGWFSFSL